MIHFQHPEALLLAVVAVLALRRDAGPTPSRQVAGKDSLQAVRAVMETLPRRQQALLRMRIEQGLAFDEIAGQLGYPTANAACRAFHEAQARLLVRLEQRGIEAPGSG